MERPTSYFGRHVFNEKAMRERLPQDVFEQLTSAINGGQQKLDSRIADVVAAAMKEWAISLGATHYAHWFHPRTELTAEKHMAFLSVDERGTPLEAFTGGELIQSEPDASSLPSGGTRSTFEARGYTAWDPTSPAFIIPTENGGTLCIPSVFLSWDGTPLDMKTPLLKAITAIEERAMRMLRLFGNRGIRWVKVTVGAEQEFFLIDEELARKRPDLVLCGRTVIG
ncbi:MAG TPA: glutamine synthetase III, partial [Thermosynergistes sp.]|nr:glutamine synthetase III [Thermosynergistes sp.]